MMRIEPCRSVTLRGIAVGADRDFRRPRGARIGTLTAHEIGDVLE